MWEWTEVGFGGARGEAQRSQPEAMRLAEAQKCAARAWRTHAFLSYETLYKTE